MYVVTGAGTNLQRIRPLFSRVITACVTRLTLAPISRVPARFSDTPSVLDWNGAEIGKFHRPVKKSVTMRPDSDIIEWLKSQSRDYQTKGNWLLELAHSLLRYRRVRRARLFAVHAGKRSLQRFARAADAFPKRPGGSGFSSSEPKAGHMGSNAALSTKFSLLVCCFRLGSQPSLASADQVVERKRARARRGHRQRGQSEH